MRSPNELLANLDKLHHAARLQAVAKLARSLQAQAGGPTQLAGLIDGLWVYDEVYPRMLATVMADAAGDVVRLRRARSDGSQFVRRSAVAALIRHDADAEDLAAWYLATDAATRRVARSQLRRRRRRDVASRLITPLLARGDVGDATILVALCEPATMAQVVRQLELQQVHWGHISAVDRELAHQLLAQALAQATSDSARGWIWRAHAATAETLAKTAPAELLALLTRASPLQPVSELQGALASLVRRDPQGFAAWLLDESRRGWLTMTLAKLPRRALTALPRAAMVELTRRQLAQPQQLARLLRVLPPAERGQVFTAATASEDTRDSVWPDDLLEILPWPVRHREARRMLQVRAVRDAPLQVAHVVAFLPVAEATPVLQKLARGSTADDRAAGTAWLVHNARRSRQGVTEVLAHLARYLKNDQDPVRQAALTAVAACPGWALHDSDAPHLLAVVQAVVEARDTSGLTRNACARVAHNILKSHADAPKSEIFAAGLTILRLLAGQGGVLDFPRKMVEGTRRGSEHALVAAVLPWLKAGSARNYFHDAIRVTMALERRAWAIAPLQQILEEAIWAKPSHASTALPLWLADPKTRDERVTRVLKRDKSIVTFMPVWQHLHNSRQDLLDPFIHGLPLGGQFSTGKIGWVFPAVDGFARWLPRQQQVFTEVLRRVIADKGHQQWTRIAAVRPVAAMPIHRPAALADLVRSPEVTICEAALGALVWTDRPHEALPWLLDNLDGDRARVAMYAVPRLARFISNDLLFHELEQLLTRDTLKVTVLKETLRLLGGIGDARAAEVIAKVWDRPKLHRDARIAALHAARGLLDHPSAWTMLAAATRDPELYVALALLEVSPLTMAAKHRPRYAQVLLRLATHPEPRAQAAFFAAMHRPAYGVGDWLEVGRSEIAPVAAAAVLGLGETATWRAAQACLVELLLRQPQQPEILRDVVIRLLASANAERKDPAPKTDRDLPATQRLHAIVESVTVQPWLRRGHVVAELRQWAALLASVPHHGLLRARLLLACHRPDDPHMAQTVASVVTQPGMQGLAPMLVELCAKALAATDITADPRTHLPSLDVLIQSSLPVVRQVAIAAIVQIGTSQAWRSPWHERLTQLRRDPSPEVAAVAMQVFVYPE